MQRTDTNRAADYRHIHQCRHQVAFIQNNKPAICILTVPTSAAVDYAKQASENGVAAIWNFANVDLSTLGLEAAVENVKLMDSLYTLTYYSRDGE